MDHDKTVATVQEEAAVDAVTNTKSKSRTSSAKIAEKNKMKKKMKKEKRKQRKVDKKKEKEEREEREAKEEKESPFEVPDPQAVLILYDGTGKVAENFSFFKKRAPVDDELPAYVITGFGCVTAPKGTGWMKKLMSAVKKNHHKPEFFTKIMIQSSIDIDVFYVVDVVIDFSLNGKKERQVYSTGEYFYAKAGQLRFGDRFDVMEGVLEKYRGWDMQFRMQGKVHVIKPPIVGPPAPARPVKLRCDDRVVRVDGSLLAHFSTYFKNLFEKKSRERLGIYTIKTDDVWGTTVTSKDVEMLVRVMTSKEMSPDEADRISKLLRVLEITPELKRVAEMQICATLNGDITNYAASFCSGMAFALQIAVAISKREEIEKHTKECEERGGLDESTMPYFVPLWMRLVDLKLFAEIDLDEEFDEESDEDLGEE